MDELKRILWKIYKRRRFIDIQLNSSTINIDKHFWLCERVANDRAIFIMEESIRKVECVT